MNILQKTFKFPVHNMLIKLSATNVRFIDNAKAKENGHVCWFKVGEFNISDGTTELILTLDNDLDHHKAGEMCIARVPLCVLGIHNS